MGRVARLAIAGCVVVVAPVALAACGDSDDGGDRGSGTSVVSTARQGPLVTTDPTPASSTPDTTRSAPDHGYVAGRIVDAGVFRDRLLDLARTAASTVPEPGDGETVVVAITNAWLAEYPDLAIGYLESGAAPNQVFTPVAFENHPTGGPSLPFAVNPDSGSCEGLIVTHDGNRYELTRVDLSEPGPCTEVVVRDTYFGTG